jgi:Bacterial PH domain
MNEHEIEPVPGLPADLPKDEAIVWQGAPDWRLLARYAFHVRLVAVYFAILAVAGLATGAVFGAGVTAVAGVAAVGLITLFAWLVGRSTLYTITERRIVMRFGVALPMCVNLPMAIVETARVRTHKDGSADLCLALKAGQRGSFLLLWPHTRPWKFGRPEPMLRALPDGQQVAALLARTMAQAVPDGRLVQPVEADAPAFDAAPQPVAA